MTFIKKVVFNVFVSTLVGIALLTVYHVKFSPKVVVFDVDGFVKDQVEIKLKGGNVDDTMETVKDYIESLPKNVIVLPNTVVLRGGKPLDYRKIVQKPPTKGPTE